MNPESNLKYLSLVWGGTRTWGFSQILLKLAGVIKGGICHASSLYWIYHDANGGSLKEELGDYMEGNNYRPIKDRTLKILNLEQMALSDFRNYAEHARWLKLKGLKQLGYAHNRKFDRAALTNSFNHINGDYVLLGFDKSDDEDAGHAVVAHIGTNKVRFFDANFGEYEFKSKSKFLRFLEGLFKELYAENGFDQFHFSHIAKR